MKNFGILIALTVVVKVTRAGVPAIRSYGRSRNEPQVIPCSSSSECPGNTCCRTADRGFVSGDSQGWWDGLALRLENGTCIGDAGGPGSLCGSCGCQKGYTCYRTITGACCPPMTCWEAEAARIDREYWKNCSKDPNCQLPPSANPGGQGIGGLK
ncbi:hypothetical protein MAR_014955 [Mya arenaria]|uniref:Uncharacterized protein n=1 Tax=Mya arenaria TaxID=6604 RepID=A0ABY7FP38_MYAAR|nr:uncharacterized protein LOC128211932 [Mya arenaria]WAR20981.1 hypothetical protein MAR_014955 [Mya arenaria]